MSDDELYDTQVPYKTPTPCGPSMEDVIKKANGLIAEGLNDQAVAIAVVHNLVQIVGQLEAHIHNQGLMMNELRANVFTSGTQIDHTLGRLNAPE